MVLPMDPGMVEALGYAHTRRIVCDVLNGPVESLRVVEGSIEVDPAPPVRRRGNVRLAVPDLWTAQQTRDLAEALVAGGVWLRFTWWMDLFDGRSYSVVVGTMRCEQAEWVHGSGLLSVSLLDGGQAVSDDRFLRPRTMQGYTKVGAITALVQESLPGYGVTVDPGITDVTLVQTTWDEDRAGAVTAIARSMGAWLFWSASAGWRIVPVPDGTGAAAWTVATSAVKVEGQSSAGRDGTYNAVVAVGQVPSDSGESTADAPYGIVYDDDPGSPTWWDGPFGHKPRFYSSPALATDQQCVDAAASILSQSKGLTRAYSLTSVAHPGLEPGDVIELVDPDEGTERLLVDEVSLPLGGQPMRVKVRQVG